MGLRKDSAFLTDVRLQTWNLILLTLDSFFPGSTVKQQELHDLGRGRARQASAAVAVLHQGYGRHHLRRRLQQDRPIRGGKARAPKDLQKLSDHKVLPCSHPHLGQQAGLARGQRRGLDRGCAGPQRTGGHLLARPGHLCRDRGGPRGGDGQTDRNDLHEKEQGWPRPDDHVVKQPQKPAKWHHQQ